MSGLQTSLIIALLLVPGVAAAHPGVDDRVQGITHRIEHHPDDGSLYLSRALLYIEAGAWADAREDLTAASSLDPALATVDLAWGLLWTETGWWRRAERALTRFLQTSPQHTKALVLRSRARRALHQYEDAAADLDLAVSNEPRPGLFAQRARDLMAAGRTADALRVLREGVDAIGPNVVLVELAIETLDARGEWLEALAWHDRLPDKLRSSPHGLKRRGDLLTAAGRTDDGRAAYRQAVTKLRMLPDSRRSAPAMTALAQELAERLH